MFQLVPERFQAHFVHYKKLEEVNEGVVVVAVFFKVGNTSNEELHKIAEKLKDVSQISNRSNYITYKHNECSKAKF